MDYAIHDTFWVVAHIHYVLFGGTIFGVFAGIYFWFPKMTGFKLRDGLGKWHFWLMLIGFNLTFFPMHVLGLRGMPRRIALYPADRGWDTLNLISSIGSYVIAISIAIFVVNLWVSIRKRHEVGDDPWEANTLEWATTSPPPPHNFDSLPRIRSERPVYDARMAARAEGGAE
jgi:cytochrome c oxidase subunit 1